MARKPRQFCKSSSNDTVTASVMGRPVHRQALAIVPEHSERSDGSPTKVSLGTENIRPEDRQRMIAEAAYFFAEQRGFGDNKELDDWLAAETQVDSRTIDKENR